MDSSQPNADPTKTISTSTKGLKLLFPFTIAKNGTSQNKNQHCILLSLSLLTILTCIKLLLLPSYRSTDFDVHRNWLSITKHLPLSEWYYDDLDGKTVHTLDYPPLFAFFEWILSHNFILSFATEKGWLDKQCLSLLGDDENDVSIACVIYQRCTVIVADAVFIWGAYFASRAVLMSSSLSTASSASASGNDSCINTIQYLRAEKRIWITTILLVFNPGVLMLDHVHFQYNGMLLGWLLLSIGCLVRGIISLDQPKKVSGGWISYEIMGAALYASLLSMKHLYLTLAPLYLIYLFRRVCFEEYSITTTTTTTSDKGEAQLHQQKLRFAIKKFLTLAIVTLIFFVTPFIPFLLQPPSALDQLSQILRRLFPFGRGLVHDYWAANIWALYLFADKCLVFLLKKIPMIEQILPGNLIPLPIVSPAVSSICLLLGMIPALFCAWKVAANSTSLLSKKTMTKEITDSMRIYNEQQRTFFVRGVVFCSFTGFMFSYHCHEKAIMTSVIPLTLLSTISRDDASLYIRTSTLGHFGLLPLLFQPAEALFKTLVCIGFLSLSLLLLEHCIIEEEEEEEEDDEKERKQKCALLTSLDKVGIIVLAFLLAYMEVVHPLFLRPKNAMEFLPLMATSVVCAIGLVGCWLKSLVLMMQCAQLPPFIIDDGNSSTKKND